MPPVAWPALATIAFKSCEGLSEPGIVLAESRDLEPALPGGCDADGKGAWSDQNELRHLFWVPGDIVRREGVCAVSGIRRTPCSCRSEALRLRACPMASVRFPELA
jgi:hypothetical protein